MIATIHTLKSKAGWDDDVYRDFLERESGVRSSTELNVTQAGHVITRMREVAQGAPLVNGAVAGLDSPYGRKLRALWIAGYDLALVRDRTDRAMLAFLERQTEVSHVRFLREPRDGAAAIEGLKSWLARAAGVVWPASSDDVASAKRAVIEAQWRLLIAKGAVKPFTPNSFDSDLLSYVAKVTWLTSWCALNAAKLDDVQRALGRKLRKWIATMPQTAGEA